MKNDFLNINFIKLQEKMDQLGEGDIDIIKAPIVIDNVSNIFNN